MRNRPEISFGRLRDIDPDVIAAHMSDPRVAAHMPLLTMAWDRSVAKAFIARKEACWTRDGLGHWAFLAGGRYVGWGGFQMEDGEWDFGLVLRPEDFGLGMPIARKAIAFAQSDPRIPFVTFLLPPSRTRLRALDRLGAVRVGEVDCDGARFLKFRLGTS